MSKNLAVYDLTLIKIHPNVEKFCEEQHFGKNARNITREIVERKISAAKQNVHDMVILYQGTQEDVNENSLRNALFIVDTKKAEERFQTEKQKPRKRQVG